MNRSMVRWFHERRNEIIKELFVQHAKKVYDTCSASLQYITAVISSEDQPHEIILNRVIALERNADVMETKLANEISKGYFPPDIRQHLFRLLRSNDLSANRVKSATKQVELLRRTKSIIPLKILKNYQKMVEDMAKSTKMIWNSLTKLGIDDQGILKNKEVIGKLEKEADNLFLEIKEEALILGKECFYGNMEMLIEAAIALEMAFDATYDSIEFLASIVYSARKE